MASYSLKRMTNPTQLGTSATLVYTVGASTTAVVKEIVVANVSASASSISIHFVPSGGATSTSNLMFSGVQVSANSTLVFDLNQVLSAGDTIHAFAGNSSAVNVMISGYEVA